MYTSHDMSAYCFRFICFDSFSYHRVESKYFESYPPVTLAANKRSKLVFLKEKSLNVMLTASGKTLHSLTSIKSVGGAGQNSLLTSWNDIVLCNSKEDEHSWKVIDLSDFKILCIFGVFEDKDEEECKFSHLVQYEVYRDR